MDVFISWAGARSHAMAEALKEWLPMIINAVKPWLSSADIDSGTRWAAEITQTLERAKFGIICLTPKSLRSEWVLFEAGALSKTVAGTYVCPLLIGLPPSEVTGPLAQFQSRNADFEGIRKLVETINSALDETRIPDAQLAATIKALWPMMEQKLASLPSDDDSPVEPRRDARDIAEETLDVVRTLLNQFSTATTQMRSLRPTTTGDGTVEFIKFPEWFSSPAVKLLLEAAGSIPEVSIVSLMQTSSGECHVTFNNKGTRRTIVMPSHKVDIEDSDLVKARVKEILSREL